MFVGDNFLTLLDRLSTKSILTGKTGTLLGIIGSITFIVISFILFIGPVIFYFKGDYIQGIFPILKPQKFTFYAGCDFKMAVSFYSKQTREVINHSTIGNFLEAKVGYYSISGNYFQADVQTCYDQYFAQMENKTQHFEKQDCFIVPNGIQFSSQYQSGYISVFGFVFQPICSDPFLCVQTGGTIQNDIINQKVKFFEDHYYVLRFTTQYFDHYGNQKKKFVELYSSQYNSDGISTAMVYADFITQKIYLDNSIMPWFNNVTYLYATWQGLTIGRQLTGDQIATSGVGTFMTVDTIQNIVFREYKKLDWLLGMLGGGIFLLFLILWVPCNFISTIKEKVENCQSIVLIENTSQVLQPSFSKLWYLGNLLPFSLRCWRKDSRIISQAQNFLDIAVLVKKLKVAARNLKLKQYNPQFKPRNLQYVLEPINQNFTEEQIRYQMTKDKIQKIRSYPKIAQIYQNNMSMLMLINNEGQTQVQKYLKQIRAYGKFSKIKIPNFVQNRRKKLGQKFINFFSSFFKLFDAFGAKPNLVGDQQNFSGFGCLLTLLICAASILTFSLTLGNMGVTRTYWDQIYIPPQKQNVQLVAGKLFKAAFCLHPYSFYYNLTVGQSRVVDIKFYQYKRQGNIQKYYYYDVQRGSQQQYFDVPNQLYENLFLSNCFLPEKNLKIQVYGDSTSDKQAYVGFKMIPHCFGTPQTCQNNRNITYQNFYNLLNVYPIYTYVPEAKYYPDLKKTLITSNVIYFSRYVNYYDINLTTPVEQQIYLDTLHLIDDYASWIMGDFPAPKSQILTKDLQQIRTHLNTIQNYQGQPYMKIKISISGKVQRTIFSSYKIDFLFATIGGCFIFYFFFFGCFGKAYNNYKIKIKLAEVLYNQDSQGISGFKTFLNWMRILCCKDQVIKKIQQDIDCVRLAKNVDSVYRLSTVDYNNPLQRNLSLIYLKQRIKADQQVVIKAQQSSSEGQDNDDQFQLDWQIHKKLERKKLNSNAIQNMSDTEIANQNLNEKSQLQYRQSLINQPMNQLIPTAKEVQTFGKFVNYFDIFHNNPQLTLNGQRSIKSVFGGIFCICLFIFICVLTSHFLTIYFSEFHRVSQTRIVDQTSENRKIVFQVGKNFKLAVSFYKIDNYDFLDVSTIIKDVGLSVIKYKTQKINGIFDEYQLQKIDLQQCKSNYLQGFINDHDNSVYYKDFTNAYCVPDGTILNLYGSADDPVREYFSLKIYKKNNMNNTYALERIKYLLENYLPRYHISNPLIDYRTNGSIRYSTDQVIKSYVYQTTTSRTYNTTITKNIIQYDTAVNPTNERPSFSSYEIKNFQYRQLTSSYVQSADRSNQLNFYSEEFYNLYVIKSIKVNQIFGIVGGCIAFLFIGFGCIPRSYNRYKMRYMIGTKLYTILGKKKHVMTKSIKGRKSTIRPKQEEIEQLGQLSQCQLMRAWVLSVWGFIKNNYNTKDLMRHSALIQSRVGKDINIFQFMKLLFSCENGIRKMKLEGDTGLNLCKIFPKQIVNLGSQDRSHAKQLIEQIKESHPELVEAAKVNQFTQWQLKIILQAKESNILIENLFEQKWLDKFFGINRSSLASRSNISRSQMRSTRSVNQLSQKPNIQSNENSNAKIKFEPSQNRFLQKQVEELKESDQFQYQY